MAKAFSWSYSKVKNYNVCPKRHYEVDIAKNFVDETEALKWGNEVHKALAGAVLLGCGLPGQGRGSDRVEPAALPDSMKDYQHWVDEGVSGKFPGREPWLRHLADPRSKILVEQKFAITKDFMPCDWFAGNAWYRGISDFTRMDPSKTVALSRDYKTGKVTHDSIQLMLMATCLFKHHPSLMRIKTEFVWLKEDCVTEEIFDRSTVMREWVPVLDNVREMQQSATTMTYVPKPGRLCARFCPVVSCPFHGKRHA
jgi:hypothetical protein